MLKILNLRKISEESVLPMEISEDFIFLEESETNDMLIANFDGRIVDRIHCENRIMYKVFCFNKQIFYAAWSEEDDNSIFTFYKYDIDSKTAEKLFNVTRRAEFKGKAAVEMYSSIGAGGKLDFFFINERYVIYWVNENFSLRTFSHYHNEDDRYTTVLYDIHEQQHYTINHDIFIENRPNKLDKTRINGKDYLVMELRLGTHGTKQSFWKHSSESDKARLYNKVFDQIVVFNEQDFIKHVKNGDLCEYQIVEKVKLDTAIAYRGCYENKVLFTMEHFDKPGTKYVLYDIVTRSSNIKLPCIPMDSSFRISIYKDKVYCTIEGSDKVTELFSGTTLNISGFIFKEFVNIINDEYILLLSMDSVFRTKVLDLSTMGNEFKVETSGYPKVFDKEDVIIAR